MVSFRERLAWLGRMPFHYKLLFASQSLFTVFAINWRAQIVEKKRRELEAESAPSSPDMTSASETKQTTK
jgi:hypothetical protein